MTERQVLDVIIAEAIKIVFQKYVEEHGLSEIAEVFRRGVRVEVVTYCQAANTPSDLLMSPLFGTKHSK